MLTQQSIRDFLAQSDYDIRESGNGRWIDQKCTPDVVCAVADFICNYVADDPSPGSCPFTSKEIWHSEYASQYVEAVFKKPTQEINEQYQHLLLLSKADRIRENLSSANVEHIYEFSNLLFVLSTGFEEDTPLSIADMDFCAVVNAINRHYA